MEILLTLGAIAIEVALVIALIALCRRSDKYGKHAIVVLGALTPIMLFYGVATIAFIRDPADPGNRFAFSAMWVMGFVFFLACAVAGLVVAQSPRPRHWGWRFLLGALSTCAVVGLFAL